MDGVKFAGWLAQDRKFYCPVCRPIVIRDHGTVYLYKFHPNNGCSVSDADHFFPPGRYTPEEIESARKDIRDRVALGEKLYWKHEHDGNLGAWGIVELENYRFASELAGQRVVIFDEFSPFIPDTATPAKRL